MGAGQSTLLGEVPDEKHRTARALGVAREVRGALSNPHNCARGGLEVRVVDGLDRIKDQELGALGIEQLVDALHVDLGHPFSGAEAPAFRPGRKRRSWSVGVSNFRLTFE